MDSLQVSHDDLQLVVNFLSIQPQDLRHKPGDGTIAKKLEGSRAGVRPIIYHTAYPHPCL